MCLSFLDFLATSCCFSEPHQLSIAANDFVAHSFVTWHGFYNNIRMDRHSLHAWLKQNWHHSGPMLQQQTRNDPWELMRFMRFMGQKVAGECWRYWISPCGSMRALVPLVGHQPTHPNRRCQRRSMWNYSNKIKNCLADLGTLIWVALAKHPRICKVRFQ